VSLGVSVRGALAAITLLLTGSAAPVHAQTKDTPPPDAVVAAFEAALDAHDANRAAQQLSDTATVLGMDSASGRQRVQAWINDQIEHGVAIEVGPLHVNGSRVTWTARISRSDWIDAGSNVRYVDEEAAVSGKQITVIAAHRRPAAEPPPDGIAFVRARTLAGAADGPIVSRPGAWSALIAVIVGGLLIGLYVVSGTAPRADASLSVQKGRLVPALARSVELRRSRELT
jgi:hypothetical protein